MFPSQSSTITLTIGGVDRTDLLRRGSVQITMRLNQRWDASFELYDPNGAFSDEIGKTVHIDENGSRVFLGKLDDIEEIRCVTNSIDSDMFYRCRCVDLTARLDQRVCSEWSVHKNVTAGYIVNWALSLFCPFEGITFSSAASPGGFIEDGANVKKFVFNKQTVLEVIEQMCQLSDKVAFIDVNGDFHFEDVGASSPAPFSITATSSNFSRISKRQSTSEGAGSAGSGYYNQSWTRTDWKAWEQRYETFIGSRVGGSRTFTLPLAAAVVVEIKLNGASADFGGDEEGRTFTWFYGEQDIVLDPAEPALTVSDHLEVWYHDMTQGFIFVQNLTEINARGVIEGNTGQHARIFDDSQETNFQAATDKAQAKLDMSDSLLDIVTLEANGFGPNPIYPRPGMVFTATLSYPSINGDFSIQEVSAQETAGAGLRYSCKCVSVASSRRVANGIDYFRELARKKPGTTLSSGGGGIGAQFGPILYRCDIKNSTVRDNAADVINVSGASTGQASVIRRIVGTLRNSIASDLTVRFRNEEQTSPVTDHIIGTFTIPAGTPVETSVVFNTFLWDQLDDLSTLKADITASDAQIDEDGVGSFVIETVSRGAGLVTASGMANIGAFDSGTTYATGDVVSYNGALYISLVDGNAGNTPDSSPAEWDILVQGIAGPGVPTGGTAGQRLGKIDGTDYNTQWFDAPKHGFGAAISPSYPTVFFPGAAFSGTIVRWKIVSPTSAPATVKVWKVAAGTATPTSSDSINTSGVSISGAQAVSSTTLSDFTTTTITAGDLLALHLESGLDEVTFELEYSE